MNIWREQCVHGAAIKVQIYTDARGSGTRLLVETTVAARTQHGVRKQDTDNLAETCLF